MWDFGAKNSGEKQEADPFNVTLSAANAAQAGREGRQNSDPYNRRPQSHTGRAIPAHMDDSEKIVLQARRGGSRREVVEKSETSMFAEKMASIVGPTYCGAMGIGMVYGLT